ncbi:MAG: flippase-like domain-containing protein [Anaerolineales bacterium]|nr:flippase-like domain-containing protein [Anaerolineales bacterium]
MNRQNKGLWLRLGGTLLTLALLVVLLSQQGWNEIVDAIRLIPFNRFLLAIGLIFISRLAVTGRWHVLLKSAGLDISFQDSARLTFSGLFASNFLPTTIGGDVVRLAGAIQLKYDVSIGTASLIVDRLIGMAGMVTALPFGLSHLASGLTMGLPPKKPDNLNEAKGLFISRVRCFASLVKHTSCDKNKSTFWTNSQDIPIVLSLSLFSRNQWMQTLWEKGRRFIKQVVTAFSRWVNHPKGLIYAFICTWVHMLCHFGTITLLLHGMGETITFWHVAGLWSFVYFITQIPISINGYGLQEVSMAFIYSNLGGISYQSSLTIALLLRTLVMFASLPGAFFVPGILEARAKQTQTPSEDLPVITPD